MPGQSGFPEMGKYQLRESPGPSLAVSRYDAVIQKQFDIISVKPLGPPDLVAGDLAALNHAIDRHRMNVQQTGQFLHRVKFFGGIKMNSWGFVLRRRCHRRGAETVDDGKFFFAFWTDSFTSVEFVGHIKSFTTVGANRFHPQYLILNNF